MNMKEITEIRVDFSLRREVFYIVIDSRSYFYDTCKDDLGSPDRDSVRDHMDNIVFQRRSIK